MPMSRSMMSMMDAVFGGPGDKPKAKTSTSTQSDKKPVPPPENKRSSMPAIDKALKDAGVDN